MRPISTNPTIFPTHRLRLQRHQGCVFRSGLAGSGVSGFMLLTEVAAFCNSSSEPELNKKPRTRAVPAGRIGRKTFKTFFLKRSKGRSTWGVPLYSCATAGHPAIVRTALLPLRGAVPSRRTARLCNRGYLATDTIASGAIPAMSVYDGPKPGSDAPTSARTRERVFLALIVRPMLLINNLVPELPESLADWTVVLYHHTNVVSLRAELFSNRYATLPPCTACGHQCHCRVLGRLAPSAMEAQCRQGESARVQAGAGPRRRYLRLPERPRHAQGGWREANA